MEKTLGFFSPLLVYILVFLLNAGMPGRWVSGYVTGNNSGERLKYRLNGLLVLFTIIFMWTLLCRFRFMPWDWFYEYRWYGLGGAILFGLIFSFAIVLPYTPVRNSFLADFFLGRSENPQLWGGRIDAKMWLYLVGAIMLELNILSFAAHHRNIYGNQASQGIYLATALLTFFVIEYLAFEEVHLYTYDFVAEKVGFKLGWGCIAFYPFFYSIPLWFTVDLPVTNTPTYILVIYGLLFFVSWSFSRGANLQKYYFKKDPKRAFLGIVPQSITDGNKTLLINGYWGMSRHINYLGDTGMAIAIVLCTGHQLLLWPWLYPFYYIILFLTRQADDDKRCALKYGKLWEEYVKRVPYKIIPFIY
jgi:protein-S-isoprenylcysteine O-methyltransferase Ste14